MNDIISEARAYAKERAVRMFSDPEKQQWAEREIFHDRMMQLTIQPRVSREERIENLLMEIRDLLKSK